jgi:hypothetical protein
MPYAIAPLPWPPLGLRGRRYTAAHRQVGSCYALTAMEPGVLGAIAPSTAREPLRIGSRRGLAMREVPHKLPAPPNPVRALAAREPAADPAGRLTEALRDRKDVAPRRAEVADPDEGG